MKVNIAVCGRFHYHHYVRYLDRAGLLGRFYYSHRMSSNADTLQMTRERAVNLFAKEYLLGVHNRFARGWMASEFAPLYADLWQAGVLRRWAACDVLHLMLHGSGAALIRRARREGSAVAAEAVNRHPEALNAILSEEHERLGLRAITGLLRIHERQVEEALASDFLLAPSKMVRDSFVARGYDSRRTAILPYGVDLERFHPRDTCDQEPETDRTFRVICVAQISPRKGQLYLLEAWKKLGLPRAELLLIGGAAHEMMPMLRRYADLFTHIAAVPNQQLRDYYARSSVFVLSSVEDGFGQVCGEAMACGLPVIATGNCGAAEIIAEGVEGFVVPIRSPEAIAERLELLYRDEELRRRMSQAALAKTRAELSWEKYASRLGELYRSMRRSGADAEGRPEAAACVATIL